MVPGMVIVIGVTIVIADLRFEIVDLRKT
jgi:hypothetical protein